MNKKLIIYLNKARKPLVFKVSKEKGKSIEHDNDIEINYWDLKEEENTWREKICPGCGREVDSQYSYCPYCGNRIK